MANCTTWAVNSKNLQAVIVAGSFAPQGTGTTAPASKVGLGWTVAQTATGAYTITFSDAWQALISATATVQETTAGAIFAQVGDYDPVAHTLAIRTVNGSGALAGLSTNVNNRVNFTCIFANTSVTPV